jgi:hypothetical protein
LIDDQKIPLTFIAQIVKLKTFGQVFAILPRLLPNAQHGLTFQISMYAVFKKTECSNDTAITPHPSFVMPRRTTVAITFREGYLLNSDESGTIVKIHLLLPGRSPPTCMSCIYIVD